jgi:lysophospholipase L1-like esterase
MELLKRILLVIVSTVVALVIAEMLLRWQEPYLRLMGDRTEWSLGRFRVHPIWHHWARPNQFTARPSNDPANFPTPIVFRTNDVGCRDDRPSRKLPGTYRVLFLGDSFTEGYYAEQTVPAVLEQRLTESGRNNYRAINCATTSYSPLLHYLRYAHQLHALDADEVVINVDWTDVYDDNWRYRPQATFSPTGEPLYARQQRDRLINTIDELRFRFYLARLVAGMPTHQVMMPVSENVFAYYGRLPVESERWQQDVAFTLGLLQRLIERIRQDGARVIVSVYPYREHFEEVNGKPIWHREVEYRIAEAARAAGAEFYSAFEDIRSLHQAGAKLYWPNDVHFNPNGQVAWANAFASWYIGRLPAVHANRPARAETRQTKH